MTTPPSDIQPQRMFTPRRRRALLSFRRKRDVVWALLSFGMFCIGLTAMGYTVVQMRRLAALRPAGAAEPAPAPRAVEPDPIPEPAAPAPEPALEPEPEPEPLSAQPEPARPAPRPEPARPAPKPAPAAKTPPPAGGGLAFLERARTFRTFVDKNARITADVLQEAGQPALRLEYDLGRGQWVQAFAENSQDFSRFTRVQFYYRGEGARNTLELKLVDGDGSNVGTFWTRRTGTAQWTRVDMALKDLSYLWGGNPTMDWTKVKQIFFAVSQKGGDEGGKGRVLIRGLRFY